MIIHWAHVQEFCLHLSRQVVSSLACVHAKSLQSCPILCDPMGCRPPGSSIHGVLTSAIISASVHSTPSQISNALHQSLYPPVWMISCLLNSFRVELWKWNTGLGCHFLLQGIFLTQGLNLGLLHWFFTTELVEKPSAPLTVILKDAMLRPPKLLKMWVCPWKRKHDMMSGP